MKVLSSFAVLLRSDRNCPGHNPTVGVRLPKGNTSVMRHPPRQDTLFSQLLSFRVPAQHCRNDFVLFVSSASDKQLVVARRNPTAGSLVGELGHQAPCVLLGAVGVERFHCPTWGGNGSYGYGWFMWIWMVHMEMVHMEMLHMDIIPVRGFN